MATSFGALCTDFYINQKLALKMDLPSDRETVLHFFDQLRKASPQMEHFRRFKGELALESAREDPEYLWAALRRMSIRSGHVNPENMGAGYGLHRLLLKLAPHHLSISPLDVDYLEVLFGFDLECEGNQDGVVYEALFEGTPLADLFQIPGADPIDVQPVFALALDESGETQASFEVKTQGKDRPSQPRDRPEPISLYVTVRRYGPVGHLEELETLFDQVSERAEQLATERLVPDLLQPIARHIPSSQG